MWLQSDIAHLMGRDATRFCLPKTEIETQYVDVSIYFPCNGPGASKLSNLLVFGTWILLYFTYLKYSVLISRKENTMHYSLQLSFTKMYFSLFVFKAYWYNVALTSDIQ